MKWKTLLSVQSKRQAILLTIAAALTPFVLAWAAIYPIEKDRDLIRADNAFLKQEISILDQRIKEIQNIEMIRERIIERMQIIQTLSRGRLENHEMLLSLSQIPDGIQLTRAEFDYRQGLIEGLAVSASLVSRLTSHLQESPARWTTRVERVSNETSQGVLRFQIKLSRGPKINRPDSE